MSTLLERSKLCSDRILTERISQAIAEEGSSATVKAVAVVLATSIEDLSNITDEQIIAAVNSEVELTTNRKTIVSLPIKG